MATKKTTTYNEQLAKEAFLRVKPMAVDLPKENLLRIGTDMQKAVVTVLGAHEIVAMPKVRARLELFPKALFDIKHADQLRDLSWAAWYARAQAMSAEAKASNARVPGEVLKRAVELKSRMMRVCEYWFSDHPELSVEVDSIRAGSGHLDLATDLTRLGELFVRHRKVVAQDVKWYRPTDGQDADRLAGEILAHLSSPAGSEWVELSMRVWTLLSDSYNKVRAAVHFAFQDDSSVRLPSLYGSRSKRSAKVEEEIEQEGEPGSEPS